MEQLYTVSSILFAAEIAKVLYGTIVHSQFHFVPAEIAKVLYGTIVSHFHFSPC